MLGLGLWNSVPATFIVEGLWFGIAALIYLRVTRAVDRAGALTLWALIVVQAAIWASGPFSAPPPTATAIALVGLALWLFPVWGAWIERHRSVR
jgi:hypothetical protein